MHEFFFIIDEEEAENDGTGAESGVSATRSSSVSEITFDKSLPRTHAVSAHCLLKIMLKYYESIEFVIATDKLCMQLYMYHISYCDRHRLHTLLWCRSHPSFLTV